MQVGAAIRTARIRRRKTAAELARRLGVSLPTLRKLEAGDPGVSLGTFVTALWLLPTRGTADLWVRKSVAIVSKIVRSI